MKLSAKQHAREAARITRLVTSWRDRLGLSGWRLHLRFHNGPMPRSTGIAPAPRGSRIAGAAEVDWRYLEATLHFSTPVTRDNSADEIDSIVVHELVHVFVNEMREEGLDHEERVVSTLTNAIRFSYDAGQQDARRARSRR